MNTEWRCPNDDIVLVTKSISGFTRREFEPCNKCKIIWEYNTGIGYTEVVK